MKVGVLQFFSWPERRVPLNTVYQRALQRIEVMDQTGYDAVWLAEHHFGTYSVCPSVHLMAMHVADRTHRLLDPPGKRPGGGDLHLLDRARPRPRLELADLIGQERKRG